MIKVLSLFSGIGAFEKALERLQVPFELVNYCEWDKHAAKSYALIHGVSETMNLGDITKVDENALPDCDLITYGFPCQSISIAGKQEGVIKGVTRSGLYYEALRIIQAKKPKYAIAENVSALTHQKFAGTLNSIIRDLQEAGYRSYYKVLNAKDFGVPQNRERIFIVSIRNDVEQGFVFPIGGDSGIRLKDVLEQTVDEKYYLSDKATAGLFRATQREHKPTMMDENTEASPVIDCRVGALTHWSPYITENEISVVGELDIKGNESIRRIYDDGGISPSVTTCEGGNRQPKIAECVPVLTPDRADKRQNGRRFKTDGEPMFTLNTQDKHGVMITEPTIIEDFYDSRDPREYSDNAPTLRSDRTGLKVKQATAQGYIEAHDGDGVNFAFPNSQTRRGRVQNGVAGTLETSCVQGVVEALRPARNEYGKAIRKAYENGEVEESRHAMTDLEPRGDGVSNTLTTVLKDNLMAELPSYRIRKLCPIECFRLQGFDDADYQILHDNGISDSQIYKMAGNSIVVNVLETIFTNLLINKTTEGCTIRSQITFDDMGFL